MPNFKDPQNKVHFLDDAKFASLLPAGSVSITDAEAAALLAPTPEDVAAAAKAAQDKAEAQALKADAKFQNLISNTPAQAKNWAQNNFPTLTAPEQNDIATLVMAIGILGRRL